MNKVKIVLDGAVNFEDEACPDLFREIFCDFGIDFSVADDIWEEYSTLGYSILNLWRQLSKENQVKLATWINDNLDDLRGL